MSVGPRFLAALCIGLASSSFAAEKAENRFYLLRKPEILDAPGCVIPNGPAFGVLLFNDDIEHERGESFFVVLRNETVKAQLQFPAPGPCSPLGAELGGDPSIVRFERVFNWDGRNGGDALLALGGEKPGIDQIGRLELEPLPPTAVAYIEKSAPNGYEINGKGRVKLRGTRVSIPKSSEQYFVAPVLYTPHHYTGEAKSEVHRTTVWKKSGADWKLTDSLEGGARVFAVLDLERRGVFQLGMYLGWGLSGSYEVREIQNGKLVLKKTLYSWAD